MSELSLCSDEVDSADVTVLNQEASDSQSTTGGSSSSSSESSDHFDHSGSSDEQAFPCALQGTSNDGGLKHRDERAFPCAGTSNDGGLKSCRLKSSEILYQDSDELAFPFAEGSRKPGTSRDGGLSNCSDCTTTWIPQASFTVLAKSSIDREKEHAEGHCKPCLFVFSRNGCASGRNCNFCHHIDHADDGRAVKELVSPLCQPAAYQQRVTKILQSDTLSAQMKLRLCQKIHRQIFELAVIGDFMNELDTEPHRVASRKKISL